MKPGYKTTEFWLSLAVIVLNGFVAGGFMPEESPWVKAAVYISAGLVALGYSGSRTLLKLEETV